MGGALSSPPNPKVPSEVAWGGIYPLSLQGDLGLGEIKPGGTAELWELEDFLGLCLGGKVCVCWGVGA